MHSNILQLQIISRQNLSNVLSACNTLADKFKGCPKCVYILYQGKMSGLSLQEIKRQIWSEDLLDNTG